MDAMTHYFNSPGRKNTDKTIDLAVRRAVRRGISHIVVASSSGRTGVLTAERAAKKGIKTVVVTYHYGFSEKGQWSMKDTNVRKLEKMGVKIVSATHALSGIERSVTRKLGGPSRIEVISESIRSLLGQGMKVCVEIAVMAADAGAIPCDGVTEVIAIGGTSTGADTAAILLPSHANSFFDLEIREIIAIPRTR